MTTETQQETATRTKRSGRKSAAASPRRKKAATAEAILVLGMHRSGTSTLTRLLSLHGADLPEDLMAPAPDNELGFFESRELMQLHDELLESAGMAWDDTGPFPREWFDSRAAEAFGDRLEAFLAEHFAKSPLFVVKDPRLCRFVPIWTRTLQRFGAEPKALLVLRNPLEVAASLKRRDGFVPAKSHLLWLCHLLDAERDTRDLPRAFVQFDELFADWHDLSDRMARALRIAWPRQSHRMSVEMEDFLSDRLRHNRFSADELAQRGDVVDWVKQAYSLCAELAKGNAEDERLRAALDTMATELAVADLAFGPVVAEQSARLAAERQRRDRVAVERDEARSALEAAEAQIVALDDRRETTQAKLKAQNTKLNAAQAQLEVQTLELAGAKTEQQVQETKLAALQEELAAKQADLGAAQTEREAQTLELAGAQTEVRLQEAKLAALQEELAAKQVDLDAAKSDLRAGEGDLQTVRRDLEAARRDLEAKTNDLRVKQTELAAMETEFQLNQTALTDVSAALAKQRGLAETLAAKVEEREARLAEAQALYSQQQALVAAQGQQIDRGRRKLDVADKEKTQLEERLAAEHKKTAALQAQVAARAPEPAKQGAAQPGAAKAPAGSGPAKAPAQTPGAAAKSDGAAASSAQTTPGRPSVAGDNALERWLNPLLLRVSPRARQRAAYERQGALVLESGLFDADFYAQHCPDVAKSGADLLQHFLQRGGANGRPPHPLFDSAFYLKTYRKVAQSGANPLLNYLRTGAQNGRRPNPLFDTAYYLKTYPQVAKSGLNPLTHFLKHGGKQGFRPHPLFDSAYYLQSNPEVAKSGQNPLVHFLVTGGARGCNPNPLFDCAYYLQSNPEVAKSGQNPLAHYLLTGAKEGRTPHPEFDSAFYLQRYPWVADLPITPLEDYLLHGEGEGRQPSETFSPRYYRSHNADVRQRRGSLLVHYVQHGRKAGRRGHPPPAWRDRVHTWRSIQQRLHGAFGAPPCAEPEVSIVIPVYNKLDYTLRCLLSMADTEERTSYEIIVVDDGSVDDTRSVLSACPGVRYLRNDKNLGFIKSCNHGASQARGDWIMFLNNDTAVLPGWLDRLRETFRDQPDAGLVGSKLVYPNGLLQEAGGIVWRDASGANYGKFDDPDKPDYTYLREVDYVSGAAIMVPRRLFEDLYGFDTRYEPAYYEDSDLAFAIRARGLKTLYQPLSRVVHFEGITSGTDLGSGAKRHQALNAPRFAEKWHDVLQTHRLPTANGRAAAERQVHMRMLILDACTPTPDQDAGSVTAFHFMRIFQDIGYKITFIPVSNFLIDGDYTRRLQGLGIECLYRPQVASVEEHLKSRGQEYDLVLLYRVHGGGPYIDLVRRHCPRARVIFDTTDLHYLREIRSAELKGSAEMMQTALDTKRRELAIMRKADSTIVLSDHERTVLAEEVPEAQVDIVPLVLDIPGSRSAFEARRDLCFIGGFQHLPNVDAVQYFVDEIWPLVKARLGDVRFYIIGSKPPQSVQALARDNIVVTGYVEDLAEHLDHCRLSVVPLRFGAGIKGKIGSSMSYGVPCVATPLAVEGMGLSDGENVLVANSPEDFAEEVARLYQDDALWGALSEAGLEFVASLYSVEAGKRRLEDIVASIKAPPFHGTCAVCGEATDYALECDPPADGLRCGHCGALSEDRLLASGLLRAVGAGSDDGLAALNGEAAPRVLDLGVGERLRAALDEAEVVLDGDDAAAGHDAQPGVLALCRGVPDDARLAAAADRLEAGGWLIFTQMTGQGPEAGFADSDEEKALAARLEDLGMTTWRERNVLVESRLVPGTLWMCRRA